MAVLKKFSSAIFLILIFFKISEAISEPGDVAASSVNSMIGKCEEPLYYLWHGASKNTR